MRSLWVVALCLTASGCVSHSNVLKDPISTLNRWEKVDSTPSGAEINVELQTGATIKGRFQGSTEDQLRVATETGNEMSIAKANVVGITAGADSLNNGAAWGLGIGAFGAWMGAAANGAGSGAAGFVYPFGLGLLLDWLHQEHEILYVAPSESTP